MQNLEDTEQKRVDAEEYYTKCQEAIYLEAKKYIEEDNLEVAEDFCCAQAIKTAMDYMKYVRLK